jgi:hypothetical protein
MIRFRLTCDRDHGHDSWFASNAAFDSLRAAGQLECPVCGSRKVDKALMAPAVAQVENPSPAPSPEALAEKLAAWRRHVEANSDYVGLEFVAEARAIHDGLAPERAIWGEAGIDEAKALIDDGVPVAPLPFVPRSKTN